MSVVVENENIPKGYMCTAKGVEKLVDDGDNEKITNKSVKVTALARNEHNNNWGMLIKWFDYDDKEHEIAIPKKLFHAQGTEIAQLLAAGGLPIVPGREKTLLRYLAAFDVKDKLIAASCTGWLNDAFVLPTESINEPEGQRIVYQPSGLSNTSKAIHTSGSLDKWKEGLASASCTVRFAVCSSLSAPVRFKAGIEAGGFHFYNVTSQGKTTLLQAAASVWGNGVDPAIAGGDEAYIQRWNSTSNALEAKAEVFNDLALIIDEIGEGDPREFGRTIYRVISGTGRNRSDRTGGLRDSKSWRVTILSAGELAVSDFIESGGGRIKGGQMVRLVDIDLTALEALFTGAGQADALKKICATHFGHVGIELIRKVPDLTEGWDDFNQAQIGEAATAITKRVRKRFALVAHTGVLAVEAGILPWSKEQVIESAQAVYQAWHEHSGAVSDIDRGVMSVKDFILKKESQFEIPNQEYPVRDRAGWKRDGLYHFTSNAFAGACGGCDPVKVKKALKDVGLLHFSKGLNSNIRVDGKNTSVVSVKAEIFSYLSKNTGSNSSGSSKEDDTGAPAATISDLKVVAASSTDSSATTATTCNTVPVAAETRINKGALPPLPLLPPENDNSDSSKYEFTEVI